MPAPAKNSIGSPPSWNVGTNPRARARPRAEPGSGTATNPDRAASQLGRRDQSASARQTSRGTRFGYATNPDRAASQLGHRDQRTRAGQILRGTRFGYSNESRSCRVPAETSDSAHTRGPDLRGTWFEPSNESRSCRVPAGTSGPAHTRGPDLRGPGLGPATNPDRAASQLGRRDESAGARQTLRGMPPDPPRAAFAGAPIAPDVPAGTSGRAHEHGKPRPCRRERRGAGLMDSRSAVTRALRQDRRGRRPARRPHATAHSPDARTRLLSIYIYLYRSGMENPRRRQRCEWCEPARNGPASVDRAWRVITSHIEVTRSEQAPGRRFTRR